MMYPPWTPQEDAVLIKSMREGMTLAEISRSRLGRTPKAVSTRVSYLRERGDLPKTGSSRPPPPPLPPDDVLRQMRAAEVSVENIARKFRVGQDRISKRLEQLGLPRKLPQTAYAKGGRPEQPAMVRRAGVPEGWLMLEDEVNAAHRRIGPYQDAAVRLARGPVLTSRPYLGGGGGSAALMCVEMA